MENNSFIADDSVAASKSSSLSIDYKRVLFRALRYWYVILICFLLGLTVAILINRYTTRIYPITTSIIIREFAENSDAKFLYSNPLVNTYRNFYNEPYIIQSYPLITSVVKELGFYVSIVKEGDIKSTEQYNSLPFKIRQLDQGKNGSLRLKYIGNNKFQCSTQDGDNVTDFVAGDSLECHGIRFILDRSGDLAKLKEGDNYIIQFKDPVDVAASYVSRLKVSWAQQGASLVNLDVNGPIQQKEIDFLTKLIENYQQYDLEKKNLAASRSLVFIDDQLKRTGDSLRMFETALENFKQRNFVTDLTSESKELYTQLKLLGEQRAAVIYAQNYYSYLEDYLKTGKAFDQVILPSTIGINDVVLTEMVNKLIDLQREINGLTQLGVSNTLVVDKNAAMIQALGEVKLQILEAISNVRATDKIKTRGIDKQINVLEQDLKRLPGAERRLVNIQRSFTLSENLYIFLQTKRAEAGISKASTTTDIIVVNPPRLAGRAISPKESQNYIIGVGAGLILPMLVFFLIELANTRIQSKEDIEKVTSIPFIGAVGHNGENSALVVFDKPKSLIAESFRAIRSNLNYFTEGKEKKVFMITSSLSGEGKTFTTINLATVFALAGKRTMIIGADLRKPKIFQDFGLDNQKGLSVYLSGLCTLEEVIQKTSIENLHLISGGPVPPNPSELILNARMDSLMKELLKQYDFILIDTPPLALITDGMVLAKYADHTVFIVRQNYTPRGILKIADDMYVGGKIKNMSLILNDVYRTGPGYGYGYGYYYGYGSYGYGGYGSKRKNDGSGYYND